MGSMDQRAQAVEWLRRLSKLGGSAFRRPLSAAPAALLATGLLAAAWAGPFAAPAAASTTGWRGEVVAWGDNSSGQTKVPAAARSIVEDISAGSDFALVEVSSTAESAVPEPSSFILLAPIIALLWPHRFRILP